MSTENSTTEAKVIREWDFRINLTGVQAPTGGLQLPEGYFKCVINDMHVKEDKPGRVIIKVTVSEGPYKGVIRTTGINIPKDDKDPARYYWRGLAESVGYGPAQLDSGEIGLGAGAFLEKIAHMYYVPKAEEGTYDAVKFYPPAAWAENKQAFEAREAAGEPQPRQVSTSRKQVNTLGAGKTDTAGPAIVNPSSSGSALGGTASKASILKTLMPNS